MKRIVVVGSNSFSGSDFIDLLLERGGYEVHGISRSPEQGPVFLPYLRHAGAAKQPRHPLQESGGKGGAPFTFHRLDLNRDSSGIHELLDRLQPAYVVNFAAQSEVGPSWENPGQWFQTNAVAVTELVFFLNQRKWLRRYLHISSPEVYGTCEGLVREDQPLNPSTPYAASKAAGDLSLFTFGRNYGFPFVMIRSTNVYGARQQLFKIIPRSFINLKLGQTIELHGGGRAVKSYIHIRDVSRGELAALEQGRPGEIYHLSPDGGIAVRELVQLMCDSLGADFTKATREAAERLGQDAAYVIDSSKARAEFGWRPEIGLNEGLAGVRDWIEREWAIIKELPHSYQHRP